MKKLIAIVMAILCLLMLCACSQSKLEGNVSDIIAKIYENVPQEKQETYPLVDEELDENNSSFWTGLDDEYYKKSVEQGIKRQYSISAIPECVALIKVSTNANVKEVFDKICSQADLRKFGCLPANAGIVASSGNYIVIIYGASEISEYGYSCQEIFDSFERLAGKVDNRFDVTK